MLTTIFVIGTVFRGKPSFLTVVVKLIIHSDAIQMRISPHRFFKPIDRFSVEVVRPVRQRPEQQDNQGNEDEADEHENQAFDGGDEWEEEEQKYQEDNDDEHEDAHNNDNVGEWDQVDSGNVFKSFEMDDIVSAWFDDGWYTAQIIEVDNANQCFTLRFIDDQQETDNYQGRWMKHIVQDENWNKEYTK